MVFKLPYRITVTVKCQNTGIDRKNRCVRIELPKKIARQSCKAYITQFVHLSLEFPLAREKKD
ncbi:hypothetical protein SERLADRAFT_401248 [Serpula lacrymans var. lacrymans S7.9]|uniref:Uncharacterized protein n=1 Tax=Serpula lacrymans var. lacrymans (strain S7.9) TaxID=578457 RepID=F8PAS9_SERL9|nr:uncharacterized protein SERLADRAFT_401248 [Serpula lacrymans var. lacrymans S7.9]EGO19917.1 hypothetical protein SERLADRAFT_401248 [Serpula lacrymans var. lacrymans S7.9]